MEKRPKESFTIQVYRCKKYITNWIWREYQKPQGLIEGIPRLQNNLREKGTIFEVREKEEEEEEVQTG